MATRGRVVVVTGASAGVGRATVRQFAREGAKIGLIARGIEGLEATRAEVEKLGGQALCLPLDVADADAVETAAQLVEERFGAIDLWINNAMVSVFSPIKEMSACEFKRVTEVTYLGYVHGTLAALQRMLPRNRGRIIQVSSALGYRSIPLQSAYCAAKHAVIGFTESLRTELIHDKSRVRVSLVHLPAVNTPQFGWVKSRLPRQPQPVPPIYQPEVIAHAIRWLADHYRPELEVGYPVIQAIMGERFARGFTDRYLAKRGYDAQQTREPARAGRPDNLWEPLPGDAGAHGRFDSRSVRRSPQLWLNTHRGLALGGACALATLGAAALLTSRSRSAPDLPRSRSRRLS
jgi:NAD(P)-dependent dehydrogenase (short-subunit alcohol dehydrogenase family)